nr:transposase [Chloroflexota bacterium]
CADRFHILKNVGEALEGCLARHVAAKRKTQTQEMLKHSTTRCMVSPAMPENKAPFLLPSSAFPGLPVDPLFV